MTRGKRRMASLFEDADAVSVDFKKNLASDEAKFTLSTDTINSLNNKIKKLEKKVAELSLKDSKPRRRVKSIKIKF